MSMSAEVRLVFKSIILLVLFALTYTPIFPSIFSTWLHDPDNSHGLLVPIISAFLVWRNWGRIKGTAIGSSPKGLFVLVTGLVLHLLSFSAGIAIFSRLSVVLSLAGLILYNFGEGVFRKVSFPLLFSLFMIPVPVSLYSLVAHPLQLFATKISAGIISNLSISVLREGNVLHLANTSLEVARACSGIRSMVSYLMLGTLFAFLSKGSAMHKAILIISAIPLALLANIARVTGTGILAYYLGPKIARGFRHEFSGFLVFGMGLAVFFVEYRILGKKCRSVNSAPH